MDEITQLKEGGMTILLRRYEKLLYSRDIADLPKITRVLFNHQPLAICQTKNISDIKTEKPSKVKKNRLLVWA